jgi:hypothetical protein
MKKFFTFALAAVAAMTVSAQTEQLKTGDHFQYNGNGYTVVGENLIENPSFDNGLDGWLGGGGGALSSTTLNTSGGIDGGAFIVPTDNAGKGSNNSIGMAWPIEKGKTYVFSYYTKNISNTSAVEKEGYIVTSQTDTPRGDETLTLMFAHEDADLAWTQNIIVTEAQYAYLQFCARWLGGAHGFDAFILAEVSQDADPTELLALIENAGTWLDAFDDPDEEAKAAFQNVIDEASALADKSDATATEFNEMIATLNEAILDYRMANADDDHMVDVTDRYLKNPRFDNGMVDWERNNDAVNGGTNIRVQCYFQEITDRVLEINGLPGVDTYIRQSVKGLPKGYYIFSVQCAMSHTAEEGEETGCYIFANGAEQDMKTAEMTGSDASYENSHPETFSIKGVVTEDSIVVGMMGKKDGKFSYVAIDNVKLEYAGFNVGIYLQALCEEVDQYLADHFDDLLPAIAYSLEEASLDAMSVLGASDEEMNAEYDKLDAAFRQAKNSLVKMQELRDATNALVDLLNTTEYPGAKDAEEAYNQAQNLIDGGNEEATYQDILDMIAVIEQARKEYLLSQEATHEEPADYAFLITNPEIRTGSVGWSGSTPGFEYEVAEFYNMDWDMYQELTGVPNGLYEFSVYGFFRTGANDGGEAYRNGAENLLAKLYANGSATSIMSLYTYTSAECGCSSDGTNGYINVRQNADEAFQAGFYADNKVRVIVTDNTLKLGVRGKGHADTSWFAFRDFGLKYFGPATQEDMIEFWHIALHEGEAIADALLPGDYSEFTALFDASKALAADNKFMEAYDAQLPVNEEYAGYAAAAKAFRTGKLAEAAALAESFVSTAAKDAANKGVEFAGYELKNPVCKSTDLDAITKKLDAYSAYATYVEEVATLVRNANKNGYETKYVTVVNEILEANQAELADHFRNVESVNILKARLEAAVSAMKKSALTKAADNTDVTDLLIANPNIDDSTPTGWSIVLGTGNQPTTTGQYWTGDTGNRYLDSWNGTAGKLNFTAYQILTDIPNGTYKLECHGRSSGENAFLFASVAKYGKEKNDSTMAIAVSGESTKWVMFPNDADQRGELWEADSLLWVADGTQTDIFNAHDGIGYGWAIREIDDIVVNDHVMTIGITCDSLLSGKAYTGTWFSADEFRLTLKTLGDNSDYRIDTRVNALNAAPVRTEYFTTDGRLLAEPQKGVNIVRTLRADGLIEVRKVLVK